MGRFMYESLKYISISMRWGNNEYFMYITLDSYSGIGDSVFVIKYRR